MADTRPEHAIVHAVSLLHARGLEGVRVRAGFYATGHWRCHVYIASAGDDPETGSSGLLAYTNGREWDIFGDGRREWDATSLADALEALAAPHAAARRPDPGYASWLREVRERTDGGAFSMYEEVYSPDDDWEARGLVRLLPATPIFDGREPPSMPVPPAP